MVKFCENCGSIIAFKKVEAWDGRKVISEVKSYCQKCGFLAEAVDPSSYRLVTKIDHSLDLSIVVDRVAELEKLKKQMGRRTHGSACPGCKSFYFTPHRVVTRGDEAGKTFLLCLLCGKMFRRPIYVPPQK